MSKELFLKIYANLPSDERDQIIVIIDGHPYSWNRAYDEVSNDTVLGDKIIKKLAELGLL